ncbi:DoxX family protein [Patulibacter defluvii]|uniref:DoxX family protein n=1 Tax=Patulibacter defluvii TaxID=3095358 RepID=UPI002A750ACC|nr:DoxX family protein [Patulibacter sp. DM4]
MDIVFLVGRVLLAAIFLLSAIGHFTQADGMAQYAQSKGVPAAKAGVVGSGVIALLAAISLIFGIWTDLGALLLVVFLIPVSVMMHAFWKVDEPQAKQGEQINFNKNLALVGAALILFYLVNQGQDIPAGLTDPLFSRW